MRHLQTPIMGDISTIFGHAIGLGSILFVLNDLFKRSDQKKLNALQEQVYDKFFVWAFMDDIHEIDKLCNGDVKIAAQAMADSWNRNHGELLQIDWRNGLKYNSQEMFRIYQSFHGQ